MYRHQDGHKTLVFGGGSGHNLRWTHWDKDYNEKSGKGLANLTKHLNRVHKLSESDGELPDAGTEPFLDTMTMSGPSASSAVTEAELDTGDAVPNFEVLESEDEDVLPHPLVPFAGVTDHLFSEAEDEDVVPSEIAVRDTLYTEALSRGWKKLR